jgi:hypothetical protein
MVGSNKDEVSNLVWCTARRKHERIAIWQFRRRRTKIGGMKLSRELRARSTRSAGRDLVDQASGQGKWQLVGKILAGYHTKFQI